MYSIKTVNVQGMQLPCNSAACSLLIVSQYTITLFIVYWLKFAVFMNLLLQEAVVARVVSERVVCRMQRVSSN
jgi:hypothetical protein